MPRFLADAAVTIVPSARETFGNLALESLSAGTPVITYRTGNLPALLEPDGAGPAGVLASLQADPAGLRRAAGELLAGPVRYHRMCGAAYCRSRNYRPRDVADLLVKGGAPMSGTTADTPLLLVDGHNLLWRAAFGTPAQIWSRDTRDKRDLTAVFMFFALLRKGIRDELPGWPEVVVVFDGEHGSDGRKVADPAYKANRAGDAGALKPIRALPDVKDGLGRNGIAWTETDDAEADDVIAALAASCPGRSILISSTDQDYYQLVRDPGPGQGSVRILNTARRPGGRIIGSAEVRARHGVDPAQFPDYRALSGDAADNIPGIRGIGAKTAAALLAGGLALEDLPASGRLQGRRGEAVTGTWEQLLTWRSMIRMNADMTVPGRLITGKPTTPLPAPAAVIEQMGLWHRGGKAPAPQQGMLMLQEALP